MKIRAYWRKWQNEGLQSHFRVIRYMRHVAQVMEKRNVYTVVAVKPGGKGLVTRSWYRWEDTTKLYLK
jgi:hypothetical protein